MAAARSILIERLSATSPADRRDVVRFTQAEVRLVDHRRPFAKLGDIAVLQGELVLGLGRPRADIDILGGLHEERDALLGVERGSRAGQ